MLKAVNGSAQVLLYGRNVGELTFSQGGCTFRYTDNLIDPTHRVLGQVFEESPRQVFREPVGLPAWFANLLPEQGSGLRRYYAARFGERYIDEARLLLILGADLPGAAFVVPQDIPDHGVLIESPDVPVDERGVHLSALAGAQLKMSILREGERLTLPVHGESGDWIAKVPTAAFPEIAVNEFLMMKWAAAVGIDVPVVDLVPAAGVPDIFDTRIDPEAVVYVVKRFDRTSDAGRVHIEDFAQVTGRLPIQRDTGTSYDAIGVMVRELTGDDGYEEYLRRLVAMVVMGNTDAHLKNWSLQYPDGRTPQLSPAYDLVCTTFYKNVTGNLTFLLGGQQRPSAVGIEEFRTAAGVAGYPPDKAVEVVEETARQLRETWPAVRRDDLSADFCAHMENRLTTHTLTRSARR